MDIPTDVWGQLALEASQVYLTEDGKVRSPFANTVRLLRKLKFNNNYSNTFRNQNGCCSQNSELTRSYRL